MNKERAEKASELIRRIALIEADVDYTKGNIDSLKEYDKGVPMSVLHGSLGGRYVTMDTKVVIAHYNTLLAEQEGIMAELNKELEEL